MGPASCARLCPPPASLAPGSSAVKTGGQRPPKVTARSQIQGPFGLHTPNFHQVLWWELETLSMEIVGSRHLCFPPSTAMVSQKQGYPWAHAEFCQVPALFAAVGLTARCLGEYLFCRGHAQGCGISSPPNSGCGRRLAASLALLPPATGLQALGCGWNTEAARAAPKGFWRVYPSAVPLLSPGR